VDEESQTIQLAQATDSDLTDADEEFVPAPGLHILAFLF